MGVGKVASLWKQIIRNTRFCNCSECADESAHFDARIAFVLPTNTRRVETNNKSQVKDNNLKIKLTTKLRFRAVEIQ